MLPPGGSIADSAKCNWEISESFQILKCQENSEHWLSLLLDTSVNKARNRTCLMEDKHTGSDSRTEMNLNESEHI